MNTVEILRNEPERPLMPAIRAGLKGKCPACKSGTLFSHQLTTRDNCENCGEELHHHRADDLPAYLNVFIVGHIIVGLMVIVMRWDLLSVWPLTILAVLTAIFFSLTLMRPLKGAVMSTQWALRMHGFGGHDE